MAPASRLQPIRALVVEHSSLMRIGLVTVLEESGDIEVVGDTGDVETAARICGTQQPDVVITDILVGDRMGLDLFRLVRRRTTPLRVVVLAHHGHENTVLEALRAGARGYVYKSSDPEFLVQAIRAVAAGGAMFSPEVAVMLADELSRRSWSVDVNHDTVSKLTERELDVFRLVGRGFTNQQIAERLVVGEATVKSHVAHLFRKLNVGDRAAAVVAAFDAGVVAPRGEL